VAEVFVRRVIHHGGYEGECSQGDVHSSGKCRDPSLGVARFSRVTPRPQDDNLLVILSPRWGLSGSLIFSHGLRRGLYSVAASRLGRGNIRGGNFSCGELFTTEDTMGNAAIKVMRIASGKCRDPSLGVARFRE
jgi:hypothetical protein